MIRVGNNAHEERPHLVDAANLVIRLAIYDGLLTSYIFRTGIDGLVAQVYGFCLLSMAHRNNKVKGIGGAARLILRNAIGRLRSAKTLGHSENKLYQ